MVSIGSNASSSPPEARRRVAAGMRWTSKCWVVGGAWLAALRGAAAPRGGAASPFSESCCERR